MSLDLQMPIKLDVTLEEVNAILLALGELPTKTNAFILMLKLREQAQMQVPKEETPEEAKDE
jgi:hypothetical protein